MAGDQWQVGPRQAGATVPARALQGGWRPQSATCLRARPPARQRPCAPALWPRLPGHSLRTPAARPPRVRRRLRGGRFCGVAEGQRQGGRLLLRRVSCRCRSCCCRCRSCCTALRAPAGSAPPSNRRQPPPAIAPRLGELPSDASPPPRLAAWAPPSPTGWRRARTGWTRRYLSECSPPGPCHAVCCRPARSRGSAARQAARQGQRPTSLPPSGLPSTRDKHVYVYHRVYWPDETVLQNEYVPPPVKPVAAD